jgi:hypothetical protein
LQLFQDGGVFAFVDGMDETVFEMVLQNDFGGVVEGFADGRYLEEDVGAVAAFLDHALYRGDVPFDSRQPIDYLFAVRMKMGRHLNPSQYDYIPPGGICKAGAFGIRSAPAGGGGGK